MTKYFFDTSSLLIADEIIEDITVISSITLVELENIKNSENKDSYIKYRARKLLEKIESCEIVIFKNSMLQGFEEFGNSNDIKILACAHWYDKNKAPDETVFITNDKNLKLIANCYFGEDSIASIPEVKESEYSGYKEITMNNEELSYFYSNKDKNIYDLMINEYLIIYDGNGSPIDQYKWNGVSHQEVYYTTFHSYAFGEIKPWKDDIYQLLAFDSLRSNQITMLNGKPGSGKTFAGLGYFFHEMEKGKLDRIILFCNPVVAKDAAKLGYYPGTADSKVLSSQVGNILASKLGSQVAVEQLMADEKLILIPCGDARGYEVPPHSGVYILEAQNYTKDLMRMMLQRVGKDSKVILDGDFNEQVDLNAYEGHNNGMKMASKVFRGNYLFGQVELKKIHRSEIAEIADKIR